MMQSNTHARIGLPSNDTATEMQQRQDSNSSKDSTYILLPHIYSCDSSSGSDMSR